MERLVILIDDDEITHLLTTKILQLKFPGLTIRNFTSAQSALQFLEAEETAIGREITIFLDLNMPQINGWQFMDILEKKEFNFQLQVFILTSSIDSEDRRKCRNYALIKAFVSKPLSHKKIEELKLLS